MLRAWSCCQSDKTLSAHQRGCRRVGFHLNHVLSFYIPADRVCRGRQANKVRQDERGYRLGWEWMSVWRGTARAVPVVMSRRSYPKPLEDGDIKVEAPSCALIFSLLLLLLYTVLHHFALIGCWLISSGSFFFLSAKFFETHVESWCTQGKKWISSIFVHKLNENV